jgi:lysophospholipase L1-like esterase
MNTPRPTLLGACVPLICLACFVSAILSVRAPAQDKPNFAKWEKEITAFEKQDKEKMPAEGGILFVGSSTIRFWDLKKSFPDLEAINRGFGGSQLADSVHFAPRIVLKYKPRIVVLYAGDNDLAARKTPEQVAADFREFAALVSKELPATKIIFLSIKPSVARWKIWDQAQKANGLVEASCKEDPRRIYVDDSQIILGPDSKPQADLFRADGLHLNAKGYELMAKTVRPYLK